MHTQCLGEAVKKQAFKYGALLTNDSGVNCCYSVLIYYLYVNSDLANDLRLSVE